MALNAYLSSILKAKRYEVLLPAVYRLHNRKVNGIPMVTHLYMVVLVFSQHGKQPGFPDVRSVSWNT